MQLATEVEAKHGNYGVKEQRVEIIGCYKARERISGDLLGAKEENRGQPRGSKWWG